MMSNRTSRTAHVWGYSYLIRAGQDVCVKELHFLVGGKTSLHTHAYRTEILHVTSGLFLIRVIDPTSRITYEATYGPSMKVTLYPGRAHQITALQEGILVEVSTNYSETDIIRLSPAVAFETTDDTRMPSMR